MPDAPANFAAVLDAPTSQLVDFSWDAVAGATSYNIYRDPAGDDEQIASGVTGTSTQVSQTGQDGDRDYVVTAVDGGGESDLSDTVTLTIPPPKAPTPTAVTNTASVIFPANTTSGAYGSNFFVKVDGSQVYWMDTSNLPAAAAGAAKHTITVTGTAGSTHSVTFVFTNEDKGTFGAESDPLVVTIPSTGGGGRRLVNGGLVSA